VWVAPSLWERPPNEALAELLRGRPRPDAIIALEDILGIEAATAASELGLEVPADLKIVGFSDRETLPGVSLTSVQLDPAATARRAVKMLIDLIDGGELEQRAVDIPVRLVRRAST